jgi:hypothetical protein
MKKIKDRQELAVAEYDHFKFRSNRSGMTKLFLHTTKPTTGIRNLCAPYQHPQLRQQAGTDRSYTKYIFPRNFGTRSQPFLVTRRTPSEQISTAE